MWRGVANGVRGKKETSHGSRCKFRETSEVVGRCGSKAKSCGSWCKFCKGLRNIGIGTRPRNVKVRVLCGSPGNARKHVESCRRSEEVQGAARVHYLSVGVWRQFNNVMVAKNKTHS